MTCTNQDIIQIFTNIQTRTKDDGITTREVATIGPWKHKAGGRRWRAVANRAVM